MDTIDWRAQLQPGTRQRNVNEIMSKLNLVRSHDEDESFEVEKIAQGIERKTYAEATSQVDYSEKISFLFFSIDDSTAQTGQSSVGDWQEEVYQKIKSMKETYLPELNEMYEKIAAKLQQHDSLPQQPKSEQLSKLKIFKTMLERIIAFLQVSKSNIVPSFKERLGSYEKQIINFISTNRPRKAMSSLQLPSSSMQ